MYHRYMREKYTNYTKGSMNILNCTITVDVLTLISKLDIIDGLTMPSSKHVASINKTMSFHF